MTTTTYTVCQPPRYAHMIDWTCARCGHSHLGAPMFVTAGGPVLAVGSGCAATLVYGEQPTSRQRTIIKKAAIAAQIAAEHAAEHAADMLDAYTAAAAELASGDWGMAVGRVQRHYHADRKHGVDVPDFPTYVAERLAHWAAASA